MRTGSAPNKVHNNSISAISRDRWQFAAGAAAIVLLFAYLQFRTPDICCGDFDGYYHIRWARMLWEGLYSFHFPPTFRALPLTTLAPQRFADQYLLFHLLLMPFTWFGNLPAGAKWAAIFFASAAVISCFWLLWRYRVRYPLLWLMAFLSSSSVFLERMNMTRAPSISLVFLIAGTFLFFERRYRWLALAGFLYVWTYNLFILLGCMALLWMAVVWWSERRVELAAAGWTFGGILAGLVINPYFPRNLHLFWENLTSKAAVSPGAGSEWYALPSWFLLLSSFVAFAAMAIGYLGVGYLGATAEREKLQRPLFLMVFATVLLIATTRSKHFLEYWPAIAIIFAAFTLQAVWDAKPSGKPRRPLLLALVTVSLFVSLVYQVRLATLEMQSPIPADQYAAGAEWLRVNVPAGETVLNVNWDDFPKLFYYDSTRPYVSGLDPMYLADANPELALQYDQISAGHLENLGKTLPARFGAHYVFAGRPLPATFLVRARMTGQLEIVYQDSQCVILKAVDTEEDRN